MQAVFRNSITLCCAITALFWCQADCGIAKQQPLKVFILAGQSNMQGHAHVRTIPHLGMDPQTAPLLAKIQNEDGSARSIDSVNISYLSASGVRSGKLTTGFGGDENKFGPELLFGITMNERLGKSEPILIIKAAWGGKSVHTDFRPPSAGPYEFSTSQLEQFQKQGKDVAKLKQEKAAATGHFYRLMIDHVKSTLADIDQVVPGYDKTQGYELAGFVWFQGWNDMVDGGVYPNRNQPGGYDDYTNVLAHFVRDVRTELDVPKLPFIIGVMGVGGPTENYGPDQQRYQATHQNFRNAMAAVASQDEFKGNVFNVLTESSWDAELASLSQRKSKIDGQIRQLRRKGAQDKSAMDAELQKLMSDQFNPQELKILEVGKSNAEFHYLGSGKIMARIGESFAEALPIEE